ncbi:hypothetical protein RJT34_18100 [Clitoria ternatea]|uniref:Uncharacterized protein n=1 Tax=Clitoria ternatea TaxID=43366 RepID=A0AAN9JA58_CLITE
MVFCFVFVYFHDYYYFLVFLHHHYYIDTYHLFFGSFAFSSLYIHVPSLFGLQREDGRAVLVCLEICSFLFCVLKIFVKSNS